MKGSKRYGRRSTPEFTEPIAGFSEVTDANTAAEEDPEDKYDSAVPRKREVTMFPEQHSEAPAAPTSSSSPSALARALFLGSRGPPASALFLANQLSGMLGRS